MILDYARLEDLVGRIRHAAHDPLGCDRFGKHAVGIEALEPRVVPPGNAVLHEDYRGVASEERRAFGGERAEHVRLQRDEHRVLLFQISGIRRRANAANDGLVAMQELDAAALHRFQVRAPCDHRDVVARRGELGRDMPADRAGAEDAQLHADRITRHENLPLR